MLQILDHVIPTNQHFRSCAVEFSQFWDILDCFHEEIFTVVLMAVFFILERTVLA